MDITFSPSNREIAGIVGVERNISAGTNDASSDANNLNAAGITTVFNTFGTGIRTWGNRNASFPNNTAPDNFLPIQRTADVVHESLENAVFQFIDQPITKALIDVIRETGNGFIRT
jgi:phage tail sheath protein FI